MADIDMQKKRGGAGWIGWVVGLLVLVLLVWWLWPDDETDEFAVVDTTEQVVPATELEAPAPPLDGMQALETGAIVADPERFIGTRVTGVAEVVDVPTDRGFWLDAGEGQRLFVVLDEMGDEVPIHVQQGQRVQLRDALVRGADEVEQVTGSLTDMTRSALQDVEVFLTVSDAGVTLQPLTEGQSGNAAGDTVTGRG